MKTIKITKFNKLNNKQGIIIDAAEWYRSIRGNEYKDKVEKIRNLIAQGDEAAARAIKETLPAVAFAGSCCKGRNYAHTTERTGWAMFDIDHISPEVIELLRKPLSALPWVVMLHVTSSGHGLRIVANIDKPHIDNYKRAYRIVAARIEEISGVDLDMQCSDFARLSLASYDPDIYYNPNAIPFSYEPDDDPMRYVPVTGPDTSEDFRIPSGLPEDGNARTAAAIQGTATDYNSQQHAYAPQCRTVDVESINDRFLSNNDFTPGSRHNTLMRWGFYLRWRGVEAGQLHEALADICRRVTAPDMPEKEVRDAVTWGYNHGEKSRKKQEFPGSRVQNSNMNPFHREDMAAITVNQDITETEEDEDKVIRENCEPFSESVYENLPDSLKDLLVIARNKREKDVLLLSCIAALSSAIPGLRIMYGNKEYSANIYVIIVGPAGAGKGIAAHSTLLGEKIDTAFDREYQAQRKEYEEKSIEWELELKISIKEKRKPDMGKKPVEPKRKIFNLTSNTSKSQFMHDLAAAVRFGFGPYLFTSEVDTMAESLSADYGKHTGEMRKIFHNEPVGQRYKVDKEPVMINFPMLGMNMTGTPEQVVRYIPTTEDGMFSRNLPYIMPSAQGWISQSPLRGNGGIDVRKCFEPFAEKLCDWFFKSHDRKTEVKFTEEQWAIHEKVFSKELALTVAEGKPNTEAIIHRAGFITMRVAAVLSGVRMIEQDLVTSEYTCRDQDFQAALDIVLCCIGHSTLLSTMLKGIPARKKAKTFYSLKNVLDKMNTKFKFNEFVKEAINSGSSKSTAQRALAKYVESGLLVKKDDGYEKTKLLESGLLK